MTDNNYRNQFSTILSRVESILITYGKEMELSQLRDVLSRNLSDNELVIVKSDILTLLSDVLTAIQVKFVETEEPTTEEVERYRKYLFELRDYRQELITPYSELRKKVSSIIRISKSTLSADLSNQAIAFPNEYLDSILQCQEAKDDETGDWVVGCINDGLRALSEDISVRIGACSDAVNEVLDCQINTTDNPILSHITNVEHTTSTSDKVYGIGRQALPAVGIGGLTSTIVATILNPLLAIGAGLAVGASFLYKGITSSDYQQRKIELKQHIAPKISLAINEMKNHVLEEFNNIEEQIDDYINGTSTMIAQEMQDCMDAIKSCENDNKEFYKSQEIMNGQMNCLETFIRQIEIMMNNPFGKK